MSEETERDEEQSLTTPGNPLRLRGLLLAIPGLLIALGVMATAGHHAWGVPVGAAAVLAAALGMLDFLGSFDDPEEHVAARTTASALALPGAIALAGLAGTFALLVLAVRGSLGPLPLAILVPAAFLTFVVGVYRVAETLGVFNGDPRPLHRRHGFWLVAITTLILLPMLGSHSLSDPWETHYGEVSREILSRDDWVSLWWAQENWFWSKPILDFWMQALAMALLGVRYQPGAMLSAFAEGRTPWPEWAVRFPIFLVTLLAGYLLYKAVARVFGRRAGLFGGLVLATMPQWFMVAHQTMTDMPFLATMSAAMACVLLGMHTDPERRAAVYEVSFFGVTVRLSAYHLVVGAVLACAIPQIAYLLSRNVSLDFPRPRFHPDVFTYGSAGNCGLPGNDACKAQAPALPGLQPALQAVLWIQALGLFLYANWGERRVQRLLFIAAWLFAALSTMAKGPAGLLLPGVCALAYVVVSRRARDLLNLELTSGLLLFLCVALPWFLAMYARHGQGFTDRLLFHDMFKRAFTHVHDTNEGDDTSFRFYVWQLGYAVFPWAGVAPIALVAWMRRREEKSPRADAAIFLAMWFGFSFALFSLMLTKFHHYILPAVPPAAMLTGILLDDMVRTSERAAGEGAEKRRYEQAMYGAAAVAGAFAVLVVGSDLAEAREGMPNQVRLLHLFTYNYKRSWPPSLDFRPALALFTAAAGVTTFALLFVKIRRFAVYGLCALGVAFACWTLDVYFVKTSPHWGQRELIAAYVQENTKIPGPIIAYQMNWKGENFYMGNRIPAFVTTGKKFQDYMLELKKQRHKTFYFVTEPHRTGTLNNELGMPRIFDKLTTPELNNKFVLVRARFD
ncbi:MAG: glycosyltransferase family 39 protein [Polyangiaceae bacterium]